MGATRVRCWIVAVWLIGAFAPGLAAAQTAVPVRTVEPPSAVAREPLGLNLGVRELPDGRVLFSDAEHFRLLLFDSALATFTTLADTTGRAGFKFGFSEAQLIGYLGDSSLVVDYPSKVLLVLDPRGAIARTAALPKASDMLRITNARAMTDNRGRLIYRATYPIVRRAAPTAPGTYVTQDVDSAPLVRADFETRQVDTIGRLKLPVLQKTERTVLADGSDRVRVIMNPLAWSDDWVVTADGSVAIVRGQDYHVDWVGGDGEKSTSPKMPFDWLRIPDAEKQRLADSARDVAEQQLADAKERTAKAPPHPLPPGATRVGPPSMGMLNMMDGTFANFRYDATFATAPLNAILDYYPPIRAGALQADRDGNVWILPATTAHATPGAVVYDVVNRKGELFERVQLPAGRSIAGFGRNGAIYMVSRDSAHVWHLERTRVKQ